MKVLKSILLFVLIALTVLALGAYVLTRSLSTTMGKERLLQAVNHRIPGTLSVDELSLSWITPSYAKNLSLKDEKGKVILTAEEAELSTPLWRVVFPSPIAEGSLKNFNLTLIADITGLSNLEQALYFEAANKSLKETLAPLYLEKGSIFYERGQTVKAHATTRQSEVIGSFSLEGTLYNGLDITFNANNLPTFLIDQIGHLKANTPARLFETLLGKTFNTNSSLKGDAFEQSFSSPELSFTLKGTHSDNQIIFDSPTRLDYQVTPQKLKALEETFELSVLPDLASPFKVSIDGDNFKYNTKDNSPRGTLNVNLHDLKFETAFIKEGVLDLNFDNDALLKFDLNLSGLHKDAPLSLVAKGGIRNNSLKMGLNFRGKDVYIENGSLETSDLTRNSQLSGSFQAETFSLNGHKTKVLPSTWTFRNNKLDIDFKLASEVGILTGKTTVIPEKESIRFVVNQNHKGGSLSITADIEDAFKPNRTLNLNTEFKEFPSEAIAGFLPKESQATNLLYALFGYSVTGNIKAEIVKMKGPFSLDLKGERIALKTEGKVEDEVAYLTQPLTASITVSEEVSTYFLDEILPLLNSAVRGDSPLQLTLSPEGFYLPLNSPSLENINIASASLDLGKLYFSRDGKLAEVLSLLNLPPEKVFSVWFTPLYFSVERGRLNLNRVDMLVADTAPIATWGYIDFPADKVRMEVGLTGRALTKAFGPLPLPKSYMLAIPLRGTTSNAKLDKTKIAAKLSSLAAMATGPQGILVGALIQIASGSLTDKVPEPTTKPLPWSIEAETPNGEEPPDEPNESLFEQGAGAILNTFLGKI